MNTLSRHQLRAARALLLLRQEALADLAGIGVATVRRFESGSDVSRASLEALRAAMEAEGAVFLDEGAVVRGRRVWAGVFLPPPLRLPASTRSRLEALDGTPGRTDPDLPRDGTDEVGRPSSTPRGPPAKHSR